MIARIIERAKKAGAVWLYGVAMFTLGASLSAIQAFAILAALWGPCR